MLVKNWMSKNVITADINDSMQDAMKHLKEHDIRMLIERDFSGQTYPINPNHKKIGKLAAYPSIRDLEVPVDRAIISTPFTFVPQIIKDCVEVGVGGAVIIS